MLARSATGESSDARSSSGNGIGQNCSPLMAALFKNASQNSWLFVITALVLVPKATTCAPVRVATSTIPSSLFLVACALTSASASTNRPSASGFRTSTVFPPKIVIMSLGLTAVSLGMFSANGAHISIATGSLSCAMASTAAQTAAAPLMSDFIASMPAAGFSANPPVSKVIPLPT